MVESTPELLIIDLETVVVMLVERRGAMSELSSTSTLVSRVWYVARCCAFFALGLRPSQLEVPARNGLFFMKRVSHGRMVSMPYIRPLIALLTRIPTSPDPSILIPAPSLRPPPSRSNVNEVDAIILWTVSYITSCGVVVSTQSPSVTNHKLGVE